MKKLAGKPPNYRAAETSDRKCSACQFYYPVGTKCRRYNVRVNPDYTCRTWRVKSVKTASIRFAKNLVPEERAGCIKLGAVMALAKHGLTVEQFDKMAGISAGGTVKALVGASILTGIPIGILAHLLHKQVAGGRGKEDELQQRIKQYRTATSSLESGLSTPPSATVPAPVAEEESTMEATAAAPAMAQGSTVRPAQKTDAPAPIVGGDPLNAQRYQGMPQSMIPNPTGGVQNVMSGMPAVGNAAVPAPVSPTPMPINKQYAPTPGQTKYSALMYRLLT